MGNQKRHTCKKCGAKRNEDRMTWNSATERPGWWCEIHFSEAEKTDILTKSGLRKPVFVELFSGSKQISAVAEKQGFKTITVDIEPKFEPDICVDIQNLRRTQLPAIVDVIWASIPCYTFSVLSVKHHWDKINIGHRQYYYVPKTAEAVESLRIINKTIDLIKRMNPKYWFIENPRGALRHMPQMRFPRRDCVSYADYGAKVYKPTDIFHNCPNWKAKKLRTCHGRDFEDGIMNMKSSYERSKVPAGLIEEILNSVDVF